jgi:hypothetical protein
MEHVLQFVGQVASPPAAAVRLAVAWLCRLAAVAAGIGGRRRGRLTLPRMSNEWLREHVMAAPNHRDAC